uniref:Rab-GAP TBC domain-containing protein n=1 Tax=Amphora coffeiformis TaxID=265554 RepID=A0A7S3L5F2_9STRA
MTLSRSYVQTEPDMRYYQGYHDIACVVLATLSGSGLTGPWRSTQPQWSTNSPGMDLSSAVLLQLSKVHLREYLREDFKPLQKILSLSFYPLLALWDRQLHDHLLEAGMSPWFCLPWIITWFAHEMRDTAMVKRIFDFFIVSHPLMPLYLSLAMLCHPYNRRELLETEPDMGYLHHAMASLPRNTNAFGWKYSPGMGYVSDDGSTTTAASGEEDDIQTFGNLDEEDVLVWELGFQNSNHGRTSPPVLLDTGSMTSSMGISSVGASECKVPLQDLIDRAVAYMQILPPRQIMRLSTRYHGPAEVQRLLGPQKSIPSCFSSEIPATSWRVAPRAPSQVGGGSNKHSNNNMSITTLASDMLQSDASIVRRIIRENASTKAVVATGYGTSRREQRASRRRRNRIVIVWTAALCLLVATWFYTTMTQHMGLWRYCMSTTSHISTNPYHALGFTLLAVTAAGYAILRKQ